MCLKSAFSLADRFLLSHPNGTTQGSRLTFQLSSLVANLYQPVSSCAVSYICKNYHEKNYTFANTTCSFSKYSHIHPCKQWRKYAGVYGFPYFSHEGKDFVALRPILTERQPKLCNSQMHWRMENAEQSKLRKAVPLITAICD